MKRQKFFIKLLSVYIIFVFVYTSATVFLFSYKNNEIIRLELDNKEKVFLSQEKERIDTKLATAFNMIKQLSSDQHIIDYIRDNDTDYYKVIMASQTLARNLSAFTDSRFMNLGFILAFTKTTDNRVIAFNKIYTIQDFCSEMGLNSLTEKQLTGFFEKNPREHIVKRSRANAPRIPYNDIVTIIKRDDLMGFAGDNGMIAFLSFDKNALIPHLNPDSGEIFAIINNEGIVAINNEDKESAGHILTDDVVETIKNNKAVGSEIKQSIHNVRFIKSQVMDWTYVHITTLNIADNKMKEMLWDSLTIFLILTAIGIIIAYLIARNMYRPISGLLKIFNEYREYDENDELTFIKDTAVSINKANSELKEIISNNRIPLKIMFLRDILYGLVSKDMIVEKQKQFELSFAGDVFVIALLEIINQKELDNNYTKTMQTEIKSRMFSIIGEQLGRMFDYEILELDYKRFVLFLKESNTKEIKGILEAILYNIEEEFNINTIAAVGNPLESTTEVYESFNDVLNLMELKFALGQSPVLTMDDQHNLKHESYNYPLDIERDLINYVIRGKSLEASNILKNIIEKNFVSRKLGKEAQAQFIFAITSTINRILQILNKTVDDFFDEGTILYMELKMCENEDELQNKILYTFNRIIDKSQSSTKETDKITAEDMVEYIQKNYYKDISLTDIAEYLHLSQGYAGILFKNVTGENFKDYLNVYRIKVAKEIMEKRKNIKIKDLAEMVGCNNANTFIRIFNRYEGKSPGLYVKEKTDHA